MHFVDDVASGSLALLVQKQGLALRGTAIALHVLTPLQWRLRRDAVILPSPEAAADLHLEREAVNMASELLLVSGYMNEWLHRFGPRPQPRAIRRNWPLPLPLDSVRI